MSSDAERVAYEPTLLGPCGNLIPEPATRRSLSRMPTAALGYQPIPLAFHEFAQQLGCP